jgi:hypothetical protein
MKLFFGILISICLGGCATMTADPWNWLDSPEDQSWKEVMISGHGREIRFLIPEHSKSVGQHVRIWPDRKNNKNSLLIDLQSDVDNEPFHRVAQFVWDEYWGGFYKKGDHDFLLDVWVTYHEDALNLLDSNSRQRVQDRMDTWKKRRSGTDPQSVQQREWFFSKYWVKPFRNDQGLTWVVENQPQVTADHEIYRIPISDHHELDFTFFVREKRWDFKDDPEWRQSRWELVKKIMNTVSIEPTPFPDEQ